MPVRLRIQLKEEEKKELLTLYEQEKVPKRTRQRIDILMFSNGGWGVSKIAQNLRCSEAMVRRTISRWITQEKD
jgi:DNA-binding NarL/FixJ family response regulator